MKKTLLAAFLSVSILLAACAGMLPGGEDSINKGFYESDDQLKEWVDSLQPGMSKGEVFARLGRSEGDFKRLRRDEIVATLFGGGDAGVPITFSPGMDIKQFLDELEGYNLSYKKVKRRHGFTSPIRVRTDETGFSYNITVVFRNGVLFEKPMLTGGVVNGADSSTLFDYLNPGTILGAVN